MKDAARSDCLTQTRHSTAHSEHVNRFTLRVLLFGLRLVLADQLSVFFSCPQTEGEKLGGGGGILSY